eukprot:gene11679-4914_t
MKFLIFVVVLVTLVIADKPVIWRKYGRNSECEGKQVLETTILRPRECVPLTGTRTKEFVTAVCTKDKTVMKRCKDSNCRDCQILTFENKKCYVDTFRYVKQKFNCREPKPLKAHDYTFKNYNTENCSGKYSNNIVRGVCIYFSSSISYRTYCNQNDGRIWISNYRGPDCEGEPFESSSRPANVCQPNWLGGLHVEFGDCKQKLWK